jgi:hypothetical protein
MRLCAFGVSVALVALECAGCQSAPGRSGAVSSSRTASINRYVDMIMALSSWPATEPELRGFQWGDYYNAAARLQEVDPEVMRRVLQRFSRRALAISFDIGPNVETKAFLLLRVMFDLPKDGRPEERRIYIGLRNWPKDQLRYDLSWPIRWENHVPRFVAPCRGGSGLPYDAAGEFAYFRTNFPYRDLSELASKVVR